MRESLIPSILSEASIDWWGEMSTVTNKTEPQDLQCFSACMDPCTWIPAFFFFLLHWAMVWMRMDPNCSDLWILGPQLVVLLSSFRKWGFARGSTSLKVDLIPFSVSSFCFMLVFRDLSSQHLTELLCPLSTVVMNSSLSATISPNKPFLLHVALVLLFYYSNRKVADTYSLPLTLLPGVSL